MEGKGTGGRTCRMLVAGEAPDEELAKGGRSPCRRRHAARRGRERSREGKWKAAEEKEKQIKKGTRSRGRTCVVERPGPAHPGGP